MKLLMLVIIILDLMLLYKLLDVKEEEVVVTNRPRRKEEFINRIVIQEFPKAWEEEDQVVYDVEVIKAELKAKFLERAREWENSYLWNEEQNLERFRAKHGIFKDRIDYNINEEFTSGLFSLATV